MVKLKLTLSYDGTNFSGYQVQPNKRTVQSELEKALQRMHKQKDIKVYASGRTDTGVHAIGQVVHFESFLELEEEKWKRALNTLLPEDIAITQVEAVSNDFHARFDALEKEYRYFVLVDKVHDVFKRNYVHQIKESLDLKAIQQACSYLVGTHDFTTFSSARATVKGSKVRTLNEARCEASEDGFTFIFRGDGFLYHMVRILVGTLLEVGAGKRDPAHIPLLIDQKDRSAAGKTAPPQGLYLWEVSYPK